MVDIIHEFNNLIPDKKPKEDKGIVFNVIKYFVAMIPIALPFIVLMFITKNDILASILGTLAIDLCLIILGAIYFFNNQEVMDKYK